MIVYDLKKRVMNDPIENNPREYIIHCLKMQD